MSEIEEPTISQAKAQGYRHGIGDGILIGGEKKRLKAISKLDSEYKLINRKGTLAGKGKSYDEGYLAALQDAIVLLEEIFNEPEIYP